MAIEVMNCIDCFFGFKNKRVLTIHEACEKLNLLEDKIINSYALIDNYERVVSRHEDAVEGPFKNYIKDFDCIVDLAKKELPGLIREHLHLYEQLFNAVGNEILSHPAYNWSPECQ